MIDICSVVEMITTVYQKQYCLIIELTSSSEIVSHKMSLSLKYLFVFFSGCLLMSFSLPMYPLFA